MPLNVVAKLAITAAMTAANMALQMTRRIEGPRLEDLDVTLADYGTPIPRFWGKRRFEGTPIIWAERLHEEKSTNKTKGGKYDEYRYYGTFAVLIADHEIEAVSRIWMDKHLVYDATSVGPLAAIFGSVGGQASPVKIQRGRNMRIYLGTEDQTADPRMESWCEDRYGADSCPAYKGVSYIVFEELPLEKFGNRIPQISVEAINTSTNNYPYEVKDASNRLLQCTFSEDCSRFLTNHLSENRIEVWDTATRTKIVSGSIDVRQPDIDENGTIWAPGDLLGSNLKQIGGDSLTVLASYATGTFVDEVFCVGGGIYLKPLAGADEEYIQFTGGAVARTDITFMPSMYFADEEGRVWALGSADGEMYFWTPGSSFTVSTTGTGDSAFALDNGKGSFFCRHGNVLLLIDKDTHTVTDSLAVSSNLTDSGMMFRCSPPGTASVWFSTTATTVSEHSTETLALIRTISITNWHATDDIDTMVYDPINHALISAPQLADEIAWRYLDRVGSAGVTLESVVEDVSAWCGLDTVDASDLTQTVDGYSVTQGTGKDMLSPLLDLHDSIVRPHDFSVQFLQLGDSSVGTLETEDFVRSGDEARYALSIAQDTDIPRRITVNFADLDKEQQTNTVIAQRPLDSVDSNREMTIDLTTYAMSAGDAQKLADRFFRRQWNGRESVTLGLTAQNLAREPGDVCTLDLDGVTRTARLEKMTLSGGALKTEWKRDFAGLHTLGTGAGATMEGRDDDGIVVFPPTKGFVLDIPLLQDGDSAANPIVYYGAGPYGNSGWPGAGFFEEDSVGALSLWNSVESSNKASWGYANGVLATASPWVWDRGNTVNINLLSGSLTSCTEADIDEDPTLNLAYLGGELINFTTATLQGDGSYTISGFKRGRRGTETYRSTHAAGDLFVLVDPLKIEEFGLSDIGQTATFRATTIGRDPSTAFPFDFEYEGNSLKPYAPARLKVDYDGTDLNCTIVRRTRLGGAWFGGTTIPLSETSEEYEVDVYNGATLKRTITVTGTTAFTYTAAMATADGITLPAQPTFKVYQMSDEVGRGYELAA